MGFENGQLVRAVLQANGPNGREIVNVLHYDLRNSGLGEPDNDPQSLADALADDLITPYAACFANTWSVQPVIVEDERDPLNLTAARSSWTAGTPTTGTRSVSSDELPFAVCGLATLHTAFIGRRARGRIFLAGTLVEGDQNAGVFNVFPLTLWQAFLDAIPREPDLAEGASTSSAHWCVYSRTQRAADADPYAPAVTSPVLHSQVHWLRSRER